MAYKLSCLLFIVFTSECLAGINIVSLLANETSIPLTKEFNKDTNFLDLAAQYGYKAKEYDVTTEDGYVLTMHRIPPKANCAVKTPIFILHGLLATSECWLGVGPISPGFIMSDDCYDVWFGNVRGNHHGRRHVSLNPDTDLEFWKFNGYHFGAYDVPAMIDYIIDETGSEQVIYIGHSQGGGVFFIMNSERPEYASKVSLYVGLAPATRLKHTRSLVGRTLAEGVNTLRAPLEATGVWELAAKGYPIQGSLTTLCRIELLAAVVCEAATAVIDAPHPDSTPPKTLQRIVENFPGGTSTENAAYFGQLLNSDNYTKFDYGSEENLKRYGSCHPPKYDFTQSNVPVIIFQGSNDHLADPTDTNWIVGQLPNVLDYVKVKDPLWNHIDMAFSRYWNETLFVPMKKYLIQYDKNTDCH